MDICKVWEMTGNETGEWASTHHEAVFQVQWGEGLEVSEGLEKEFMLNRVCQLIC